MKDKMRRMAGRRLALSAATAGHEGSREVFSLDSPLTFTRPPPLLRLERIALPPESARGCGSCFFSSLIKTSGWWIRGQTGTFDPPPAPARFLQADPAGEQEARGRAGNEDQAPDQDLAAAGGR